MAGLSFYTSEKTLREAFEPFGELVEGLLLYCRKLYSFIHLVASEILIHWTDLSITVKIIMDRISKRSKGYAFIEYTTEEAGGAALKAMNGQVGDKIRFATANVFEAGRIFIHLSKLTVMLLFADNKRLDDSCWCC
jgi:RNA recognition motif-containing protein